MSDLFDENREKIQKYVRRRKNVPKSYLLGFSMHEWLTADQRILHAGDEIDPEIPQTHHLIFFVMFSSLIGGKCAEKLLFGAYIRLLLNRGEVLALNMEGMRAFRLAGTWRSQQSNPRSNSVDSRREIVDQTWPFCCLLSKNSKKFI